MKNLLLSLLLFISASSFGQIKFSDLPTYLGNGDSVFVPVVVNGANRKMYGKDLAKRKHDSIVAALTNVVRLSDSATGGFYPYSSNPRGYLEQSNATST